MMQFLPNRLKQIFKPTPKDFYLFSKYFDDSEVQMLLKEMKRLEDDPDSKKPRAHDPLGRANFLYIIHHKTELFSWLKRRIEPALPFKDVDYRYYSMNFYRLQIPYALHCDNLGEKEGFYQMIIPLSYEPADTPPTTIIFDQTSSTYTEWISPAFNKAPDYKPYRNKPIYDPNWYGEWSDEYKISEADGLKYWGKKWDEMYREGYKGFSIRKAYQWQVGDLFIFDSKFNHCASHLGDGLTRQKEGILVCLERVNPESPSVQ